MRDEKGGEVQLILEIFKLGKALLLSLLMGPVNHLPKIFPLREQHTLERASCGLFYFPIRRVAAPVIRKGLGV